MGYILFFLNFCQMPWVMLWSPAVMDEYLTVWDFSLQKKLMLMSAHDSILSAWVKQTWGANCKQQNSPFKKGDLVYLSSKNIAFTKGLAWKIISKFIGLYLILRDYGKTSFQLDLPSHLKRHGIHDVFHSSLLHICWRKSLLEVMTWLGCRYALEVTKWVETTFDLTTTYKLPQTSLRWPCTEPHITTDSYYHIWLKYADTYLTTFIHL